MALKTYSVFLCAATDELDWKTAREVDSTSHREAALLAFKLVPGNNPAKAAVRAGVPAVAWVWDESHPKHANGAPICVHKLELVRPAAEVA